MSFRELWERSERSPALLGKNHGYTNGGGDAPEFHRVEEYDAAMPNALPVFEGPLPEFLGYDDDGNVLAANAMPELTHVRASTATRTFCGASLSPRRQLGDPWKAWSRTRAQLLLGGGRVGRTARGYTVFPADEGVNKAIIGCANKFFPTSLGENGVPRSEEFRDLCSHLALDGVRKFADGTFSTYYLKEEAVSYLRKVGTDVSTSTQHLKPRATK